MEANEPNTTNQTSYILLNNELEKIQGQLTELTDKVSSLASGIRFLVKNTKELDVEKKPSLSDSLPDDEYLDKIEADEMRKAKDEIYKIVSIANKATEKALSKFNCIYPKLPQKPNFEIDKLIDSLPTDDDLDFTEKPKESIAKKIYNSCLTEEELDAIDKKEMENYCK